jgi:hypothetical protein
MRKRAFAVFIGALLMLALSLLGCSMSQVMARRSSVTPTPTRTPRPTWTPMSGGVQVATPTLDPTRYPLAWQLAQGVFAAPPATPQQLVPGSEGPIFVPQPPAGGSGVQTVVVVRVTATPLPSPTTTPLPPTGTPPATSTPGPPTATPTVTNTPLPPVVVKITTDQANVRQGPGQAYPAVARLDAGTEVTVVGRNRAGDWWKICCVNGVDVWVSASVAEATGPLWTIAEVPNIPPPPPAPPRPPATFTPAPTATYAWPFRLEGAVQEYPGNNWFSVIAAVYNGATPLWGYRLKVRNLSTGEEWLSDYYSQPAWFWEVTQFPDDHKRVTSSVDCPNPTRKGLRCVKANIKWDSAWIPRPLGNATWEVTLTDRLGTPVSSPVSINTSEADPKWHYVVFTSNPYSVPSSSQ